MQRQAPREMVVGIFLSLGDLIGEQLEGGGDGNGWWVGRGIGEAPGGGGRQKALWKHQGEHKDSKGKRTQNKISHRTIPCPLRNWRSPSKEGERERERERERLKAVLGGPWGKKAPFLEKPRALEKKGGLLLWDFF